MCFIRKIRRRSFDDVAFTEFDRNPNFILAGSDLVKNNSIFFNCVLLKKIKRRSLDDVAFAEFDRNPNFILVGSDLVKKNSIFIFIFNCVLFKKLEGVRLMT